jgi:hypothetical protein
MTPRLCVLVLEVRKEDVCLELASDLGEHDLVASACLDVLYILYCRIELGELQQIVKGRLVQKLVLWGCKVIYQGYDLSY